MRREGETAAAPARLEPILDRLLPCLRECIALDALILFGSRAQDDAFDQSDWDFAVVSADFRGLDPLARGLVTVDCRLPMIDLVHLTPEELLHPEGSYLRCAILEDGRAILDEGAFRQAQERFEERKAAGEIVFRDEFVAFG